jgi:hypothetical protein
MIADHPTENPRREVIHHRPNPQLIWLLADEGLKLIEFPHLGQG